MLENVVVMETSLSNVRSFIIFRAGEEITVLTLLVKESKMKLSGMSTLQQYARKTNHYTFLGNCPPTPPLSQHFALSEK